MKLQVGLVGLGDAWENRHRPALRALGDRFDVRAVCTEVAHRAAQAAGEFDAAPVDGFRALALRQDVDAVLMLAPQWYGALPIMAACEAGKAVYCAAALDLPAVQAEVIRDRVQQAGIAFMAEFPRRQAPATLRLKELIATHLGQPRLLFCHRRASLRGPNGQAQKHQYTSETTKDMLELVDWCRYIIGSEPTSVVGVRHAQVSDEFDYEMMSIEFADNAQPGDGPMAQISCGQYMPSSWHEAITFRPPAALQVSCEHGVAFIDLPATVVWFDQAGRHLESLEAERPAGEQLLLQFHRAVTSLVRKAGDLEDAYRAMATVRAAQESFATGQRVVIDF